VPGEFDGDGRGMPPARCERTLLHRPADSGVYWATALGQRPFSRQDRPYRDRLLERLQYVAPGYCRGADLRAPRQNQGIPQPLATTPRNARDGTRSGDLAIRCYAETGLARSAIVLTANDLFIEAKQLRIPKAADLEIFETLIEGLPNIEIYGFQLPDPILLKNARSILDALADETEALDTST